MLCNISDASLHLGYRSRSTLQRLVHKGHLDAYLRPSEGREVLLETDPPGLPSLRATVRGVTQFRPGSPLWDRPRRAEPVLADDAALDAAIDEIDAGLAAAGWAEPSPDWPAIAEQLNDYLGPEWPAPPWDGAQAATVAMCLALAQEAVDG